MVHFDLRDATSYVLDPAVNLVPGLPLGPRIPAGRHSLRFTGAFPTSERRAELVALPGGCAFDLLGVGG